MTFMPSEVYPHHGRPKYQLHNQRIGYLNVSSNAWLSLEHLKCLKIQSQPSSFDRIGEANHGGSATRPRVREVSALTWTTPSRSFLISSCSLFLFPTRTHRHTMGLISRALKITAAGTVATVGVFFGATRNDVFEPMDTTDPIFSSPFFAKFNPNRNPTLHVRMRLLFVNH